MGIETAMRCKYIWNREIFTTLQESETPKNELSLAEVLLQKDETRIRQAMRLHPTKSQPGGRCGWEFRQRLRSSV
jgi:hypothetical protein